MDELMEFSAQQKQRIAELLGVSSHDLEGLMPHLRRIATDYYTMERRPIPPKQAAAVLKRFHAHAVGMVTAFQELADEMPGTATEWLLKPVRRSVLRAGVILDTLPTRFPKNQPDWQARALVYDLLLIWRRCHGKMPAKGPRAPFTRFVRAMFEMLEGRRKSSKPRDARALITVAMADWRHYYEEPHEAGERLEVGTPEFEDYMAHQDAEDFFARAASLIIGQL